MAGTNNILPFAKRLIMSWEAKRQGNQRRHFMSEFAATKQHIAVPSAADRSKKCQGNKTSDAKAVMEDWVPHPRTGIYIPKGHDWVMDDVPDNAAALGQGHTFWLRNCGGDGAEKHSFF